MKEIESLIRSLNKDGKTPRAIATELYDRGVKNEAGKFLTPDMIEGFLRHALESKAGGGNIAEGEALKAPGRDAPQAEVPAAPDSGRDYEIRSFRPRMLKPWPEGVNYGGDNCYPDAPPYNYTHPARYCGSDLRGGSSASQALMGGH